MPLPNVRDWCRRVYDLVTHLFGQNGGDFLEIEVDFLFLFAEPGFGFEHFLDFLPSTEFGVRSQGDPSELFLGKAERLPVEIGTAEERGRLAKVVSAAVRERSQEGQSDECRRPRMPDEHLRVGRKAQIWRKK